MKRGTKIIALLLAALVALVLAGVIILPLVINPNDYKTDIAAAVKQHTGRELRIPGTLRLSVFPWLGLQLGQASLGNATGFGKAAFNPPFAQIKSAQIRVRLTALLRGRIEVGTVVLNGLRLDLQRNAHGVSNWTDLLGRHRTTKSLPRPTKTGPTPTTQGGGGALATLAIGGLEIRDAGVTWHDAQHARLIRITDFNLRSGAIAPATPFPLQLAFTLHSTRPALQTRVRLKGRISVDLRAQTLRLSALTLNAAGLTLSGHIDATRILGQPDIQGTLILNIDKADRLLKLAGATLPRAQGLDGTRLRLPFTLSLRRHSAVFKGLTLRGPGGLELEATLSLRHLLATPSVNGLLITNRFSPRQAITELGLNLPSTADPDALGKASLSTRLTASANGLQLDRIKLGIDTTTLSGTLSVRNFAHPVVRFQLRATDIDADRYRPPPTRGRVPAGATAATASVTTSNALPVALLRKLDIDGTLRLGTLTFAHLHSSDLRLTVRGKGGRLRLAPISARLYQGRYAGNIGVDVSGRIPQISLNEALSNVHLGPLLKDLTNTDRLSGVADIRARLSATGSDAAALKRSARGTARFALRDGALRDVNINAEICRAYALARHQPLPAAGTQKTNFTTLSGSVVLAGGLAHNNNLRLTAPLLKITGKGSANLINDTLDYDTDVVLAKSFTCTGGNRLSDLKWVRIPLHIGGSFAKPTFRLDLARALRGVVKRTLRQKEQTLRNEVKDRLQKKLKHLFKF